jgi:hypothetical protein
MALKQTWNKGFEKQIWDKGLEKTRSTWSMSVGKFGRHGACRLKIWSAWNMSVENFGRHGTCRLKNLVGMEHVAWKIWSAWNMSVENLLPDVCRWRAA